MESDATPLERLEAASREIEELATRVALHAKAFGGDHGARPRINQVRQRLHVALDELAGYPESADDLGDGGITDE